MFRRWRFWYRSMIERGGGEMYNVRSVFPVFGNVLLFFIIGLMNDELGRVSLHVLPCSLAVYYFAVTVSFWRGMVLSLVSGVMGDGLLMMSGAMCSYLFPMMFVIIYMYKDNLKSFSLFNFLFIINISNFIFLIVLYILSYEESFGFYSYVLSCIGNIIISQVMVTVMGWWFIGLQRTLYRVGGEGGDVNSRMEVSGV